MKKIYLFTAAVAATVALLMGFASCADDPSVIDDNEPITPRGPTSVILTIGDANATADEVAMHTVRVLIYQQTGSGFVLEQDPVSLDFADFEAIPSSDGYRLTDESKITTTTGEKRIFVAMNYTGALPAAGSSISEISSLITNLTAANDLSNTTTGFAMFSTAPIEAMLVPENDPAYSSSNSKIVLVKRMVAKVSVDEASGLSSGGTISTLSGTISNLQFALGNINRSTYVLQHLVGQAPDIVVQDPNWATFSPTNFFAIADYSLASGEYVAVNNVDEDDPADYRALYATENTAETYETDGSNLTYVSVRAQFAPSSFSDASGASKGANTTAETFWTVTLADGSTYYFNDEAEANSFLASSPGATKSDEYTDGICYWRGYLNAAGAADATIAGSKAAKFDVLRNVFYRATIRAIKAPGYPDDESSVTEDASLTMEIEVVPWQLQTDDWEF